MSESKSASQSGARVALEDLPTLTHMHQRSLNGAYAEIKSGAMLVLTLVLGVVFWSSITRLLLHTPAALLVGGIAWFLAIRWLAAGGSAGVKKDLTGQTVVITGGNSGIGLETCIILARMGAHVIMGVRSPAKCEDARARIAQSAAVAPERITLLELDLASQSSVRAFARAVLAENKAVNLLINNAACGPTLDNTADGKHDLLIATNHLGVMLLTLLLAPNVKRCGGRIVNVASGAHDLVRLDTTVDQLLSADKRKNGVDKMQAYSHSKLCNVLFTVELQRRLQQSGSTATAYSVHPGSIHTNLLRRESALTHKVLSVLQFVMFKTPVGGAQTTVYCALSPDAVPGGYHADNRMVPALMRPPRDVAYYAEFWSKSLARIDPNGELPKVEAPSA